MSAWWEAYQPTSSPQTSTNLHSNFHSNTTNITSINCIPDNIKQDSKSSKNRRKNVESLSPRLVLELQLLFEIDDLNSENRW